MLLLVVLQVSCDGRPARLIVGVRDTVIVHSLEATPIPTRVLSARGRLLEHEPVLFRWLSGSRISVSDSGLVTCAERGEGHVQAMLNGIETTAIVLCEPIKEVRTSPLIELMQGDSAQHFPMLAIGVDGRRVELLAGTIDIGDSSIVSVAGMRVYPRRAGMTLLRLRIGQYRKSVFVTVFAPVQTLDSLRPDEPVAIPVQLASGEMRRWTVPAGTYVFSVLAPARDRRPRLAVERANCRQVPFSGSVSFFCTAPSDAAVILYNPWRANDTTKVAGALGVRRIAHLIPLLTRIWPLPDDLPHAAGTGDLARVKQWVDASGAPALGNVHDHFPHTGVHQEANDPWDATPTQKVLDTALAWSVINHHFDVADFLLAHGADINTRWNSHEPASILHHLVFDGTYESMRFLIDRGIDMTIKDYRWNSNAQGWALYGKRDEQMAQWLAEAERQQTETAR